MKTKISIKTTGVESTPALVDFVNNKLVQVEKFLEGEDEVFVEVEIGKTTAHHRSGDIFKAEVNLSANGKRFRVEETSDDLYAAIDIAKDELMKQVRDRHDKDHTKSVKGGRKFKDFLRGFKPWK